MTRPVEGSSNRSRPSTVNAIKQVDQPIKVEDMRQQVGNDSLLLESNHPQASRSIKAVAVYEIVKGLGAILAAIALWLWHQDLNSWLGGAVTLWRKHFGQFLINQVDSLVANAILASHHWKLFLVGILAYASLRFIEAYGLWTDKTWAYWFSVLGYGIFIPLELYYLIVSPVDWFKISIFGLNVIIVIVVYRNMKRKGLI